MFDAIEIDGEPYLDGGFAGNPTITPLVRESDAHDSILVQINPRERRNTPREILNHLDEISFNAPLMKELRMIALLRQSADLGTGEGAEAGAHKAGEGYQGDAAPPEHHVQEEIVRERATTSSAFDPAEIAHGDQSRSEPPIALAALPLIVVVGVNLPMPLFILPRVDASNLAEPAWGSTSLAAAGGVWAVVTALAAAIVVLMVVNFSRLPTPGATMDAGANAAVPPLLSVASLVGFGSVVAALSAFALVRDWVLGIGGGPLVSLAVATNVLASLTDPASGGLTIALDALGCAYMKLAAQQGISPDLLHRVAVIGPDPRQPPAQRRGRHPLSVWGSTHRESYLDIVMVAIVDALVALVVVTILGSSVGSF
jgi:hypothetical protein